MRCVSDHFDFVGRDALENVREELRIDILTVVDATVESVAAGKQATNISISSQGNNELSYKAAQWFSSRATDRLFLKKSSLVMRFLTCGLWADPS